MIGEKELSITAKRWCIFPESNICLFGMPKLHSLGDNKNGGGGIAPQKHRHGSPPQMPSFFCLGWKDELARKRAKRSGRNAPLEMTLEGQGFCAFLPLSASSSLSLSEPPRPISSVRSDTEETWAIDEKASTVEVIENWVSWKKGTTQDPSIFWHFRKWGQLSLKVKGLQQVFSELVRAKRAIYSCLIFESTFPFMLRIWRKNPATPSPIATLVIFWIQSENWLIFNAPCASFLSLKSVQG